MKKVLRAAVLLFVVTVALILCSGCRSGDASNGEVFVYCYGDYFDPDLIDTFQEETGIHVTVDYYDTAEEMYTVIDNNATSYDVICTSDYMIEKMIDNDKLLQLNKDNIPELSNISDIYMKKSEVFDPDNRFSVPYQVGVSGVFYNSEMTKGKKIDSWSDLWNPEFKEQLVMPDSVREGFMIALKKNGKSLNSSEEKDIKAAADELKSQKPLVYKYANDSARDLLADGSAAVGVAWNGEYIYITDLNPDVSFVIPEEGTEFFIDSWVIPADCKNKDNAEAWINFLTRADIAAANFDYLGYTTPNKAAMELIDEEYKSNPSIFPPDEVIEKCETLRKLDADATELYSNYWKQLKAD